MGFDDFAEMRGNRLIQAFLMSIDQDLGQGGRVIRA